MPAYKPIYLPNGEIDHYATMQQFLDEECCQGSQCPPDKSYNSDSGEDEQKVVQSRVPKVSTDDELQSYRKVLLEGDV